jgi:hypothetical protein
MTVQTTFCKANDNNNNRSALVILQWLSSLSLYSCRSETAQEPRLLRHLGRWRSSSCERIVLCNILHVESLEHTEISISDKADANIFAY